MPALTPDQERVIDALFTYHSPDEAEVERLAHVRNAAKHLAGVIFSVVPEGPDRYAAVHKLREAVMTANAGIVVKGAF